MKIDEKTFKDNSNLLSVNITNCPGFDKLEPRVFESLPRLNNLNFHRSGLTEIDESSADWEIVSHLDLSNNPLDCACHLEWLQRLLKNRPNWPSVRCYQPAELAGSDLSTQDQLLCDLNQSPLSLPWVITLIGLAVIASIALIGLLIWYCRKSKSTGKRRPLLKRPKSGIPTKADIKVVPAIPEDMTNYREVENIYEDLADMPLGSAQNYPDIKTTVL